MTLLKNSVFTSHRCVSFSKSMFFWMSLVVCSLKCSNLCLTLYYCFLGPTEFLAERADENSGPLKGEVPPDVKKELGRRLG